MAAPVFELRFEITQGDWVEWVGLMGVRHGRSATWRSRSWSAFEWVSYGLMLLAWAYLAASAASSLIAPRWWNLGFVLGFIAVAGVTAFRQQAAVRHLATYRRSIYPRGACSLRVDAAGATTTIAGLTVSVVWASVTDVVSTGTITLIAYDKRGAGLIVPHRVFPDAAARDAFLAGIEAHRRSAPS